MRKKLFAPIVLKRQKPQVPLSQAANDREDLARILKIPDTLMKFVEAAPIGSGLIYCGRNGSLPFKDDFPTDTKLYRLMTTKFGE